MKATTSSTTFSNHVNVVTRIRLVSLCLMLIVVLGAGSVWAQSPAAGSNIGQRISPDDARMIARGGWGMATVDTTHPGFKNLASLAYVRHVVLKYTGFGEVSDVEGEGGSRQVSGVYTPSIQFALPVIKNRLGVTSGFSMNRSSRWDARVETSWIVDTDTIPGAIVTTRKGTRFRVPVGIAYRLTDDLSLAGALNREFGSTLEFVSEIFDAEDVDANLKETKDLYSGSSYNLALLWKPSARFSMGASWTPAYDLDVDRQVKAVGVTGRFTEALVYKMPEEFLAGFQFRFSDRWQFGSDGQYMPFSKFSGNDVWAADMADELTLGFGVERLKANVRRAGMRNLPLRFGAKYHRWAYHVGGEQLEEYTISVGTGFAFARDLGQLDLSLSYGVIGDLEKNGVQSDVYRLGVSITGLEAWW